MLHVAIALLAYSRVQPPLTLRLTTLMNGVKAGLETDTFNADGSVDCAYEYNDRGRGPKVAGKYKLDGNGVPVSVDLSGVDYFKAPIDEHFATSGGSVSWHSTQEKGQAPAGGFYISNGGGAGEIGLLASALLRAKGPITLYPGGEARIEKLADCTVRQAGKQTHVTEYAISGLSFAPGVVWLDDDHRFFATPSDWQGTIREGWEGVNHQLFQLQTKGEDERLARTAKLLSQHPRGAVAFTHVRLFDSEHAQMLEDQTVVVQGKEISQVGPSPEAKIPGNVMVIDGTGKTLLPGLFDMHVHTGTGDGLLHIACGVTSVRDMGNSIEALGNAQRHWDNGDQIGPRVFKAGLIDGRGPYQCPTGLYAGTLKEALDDVNKYADHKYIQIKIYSSLNPDFVTEVAKLAHQRGLRVSGHVPQGLLASKFVEDGADEIQHMNFIMLNFLGDKVKDTRTPERFTAVGQYSAGIDQESPQVQAFIKELLEHKTTVDATAGTFEGMYCARAGVCSPSYEAILDRLPVQVRRGAYSGGLATTPATDQLYKDSYAAILRMLKRLYDAGVPILAGTDDLAGFMLHRELELEVQAGIPPLKALQIATWNAARLLKQEGRLGVVRRGAAADLILVDGNPGEKISDIRRGRIVMKNGVLFRCDQVLSAIGVKASD
jgi:imidazolonepropionase-like amidohydrolase